MINQEQFILQQYGKVDPTLFGKTQPDEDEIQENKFSLNKELLEVKQNKVETIDKQSCYLDNSQQKLILQKHNQYKQITNKTENKKNQQQTQKERKKTKRWNMEEDKLYIKFLQQNAHLFRYKSVRRVRQIFILLSEKMGKKKTPAQCKTHHQKMKNATERGTVKEIISYVKQRSCIKINYKNYNQPITPIPSFQSNLNDHFLNLKISINSTFFEQW